MDTERRKGGWVWERIRPQANDITRNKTPN